jgi:parallel beta helix pectate lyase-like protein/hemolysin type calcium-binding protein
VHQTARSRGIRHAQNGPNGAVSMPGSTLMVDDLPSYTAAALTLSLSPDPSSDATPLINRALLQLGPGGTLVLSAGTYALGAPMVLLPGQTVIGRGAAVVPLAAMDAMVEMAPASSINGLLLQNSDGLAKTAVRTVGEADAVSHVMSATIIGFSTGIQAESGAYDIESSFFLNNGVAVAAAQATADGILASNYVLGGSGFDLAGGADRTFSTDVVSNVLLPALDGAFGIRVTAGALIRIERNVVDQIISGPGIIVDGDSGLIGAATVANNYVGANLYATAATDGIQISGPLSGATIAFNTFAGWGGYDLSVTGGSGLLVTGNNLSSTGGRGNVRLASAQDATLLGNQLENRTASLVEDESTNSTSVGNTFASAPDYAAASSHSGNRGDLGTDTGPTTRASHYPLGSVPQNELVPTSALPSSGTEPGAILDALVLTAADLDQADNAGVINAALARLYPGDTLLLPAGSYGIGSPIQLSGRNLVGIGTTLVPLEAMASAVVVSGGFSTVAGLHLSNAKNLAENGITIAKPADNLPTSIQDNVIDGFARAIGLQGDNFSVQRNTLTNNGTGVYLGGSTLNGRIMDNQITGGNGIDLEGGGQQPEGVDISGNVISLGETGSYGVLIRSGLAIQITGNTINHVVHGQGIVLDASNAPVAFVSINGNFISGSAEAGVGPNVGVLVRGNVTNTTVAQNRIVNWSGYDIQAAGANKLYVGGNSFDSASNAGNVSLDDVGNATVLGNMFGSAVSPVVSTGSTSALVTANFSSRLTVQANVGAIPVGLSERNGSSLAITVTGLPDNGLIARASGAAVAIGDVLSSDDLGELTFTPTEGLSDQSSMFSYTAADGAGNAYAGMAVLAIASMINPDSKGAFAVTNLAQALSGGADGTAYNGPVTYLDRQLIWSGSDAIAARANVPNTFLHGGSGDDALQAMAGSNVLDGGPGSNFLIGALGTEGGTDIFFTDARGTDLVWSTLVNFHAGDFATLWGFDPGVSSWHWDGIQGVGSYIGATLRADVHGTGSTDASITFAGLTTDQATKLEVTSGNIGGNGYLLFHNQGV